MKEVKKENNKDVKNEDNNETKGGNDNDNDEDDDIEVNAVDDNDGNGDDDVLIRMSDAVAQTFAAKYLLNFTKAATLSKKVCLSMGPDVPLMCSYEIDNLGDIAYYLAPKIDDDE